MAIQTIGFGGSISEVETNTRALRTVIRPSDVGALGAYSIGITSGVMAAGLAAAAPVASLRYGGSNTMLLRRILLSAGNAGTAFTAGTALFSLLVARSFTVSDSGGTTVTPTLNKMRTTMGTTAVASIMVASTASLTAGTRTLDSQPLASTLVPVSVTASSVLVPSQTPLIDRRVGDWPLVLAQNEGIVLLATVPATGTWSFSLQLYWEEVSIYGAGIAA